MAQFDLSVKLEYDVIVASDFGELIARVNKRIQSGEGWQPIGGIAISPNTEEDNDGDSWFYQAVVREVPKGDK